MNNSATKPKSINNSAPSDEKTNVEISIEDRTLSGKECEALLEECFPDLYKAMKKKESDRKKLNLV